MHIDEIRLKLINEFPYYAENNLFIKPKVGALIPFRFNRAQRYAHEKLEEQKKRTGKVRAIFLKGRQQGISTYIGGREYHRTTTIAATDTFIFSHEASASDSLFGMVKNFYDYSDREWRPDLGKSNAKELLFTTMKSGYKVGTAGTGGLGRGKTFQNLHWSEVAYSKNCDEHSKGVMQTVADVENTEIILESTSNGQGDYFHRMCMNALSGDSDYQLIFIPWFWQDEYTRPLPEEFELQLPQEGLECLSEQEYFELYEKDGLTKEHLAWRRNKIKTDFEGDVMRFMREYPFNVQEAFQASDEDSYIKAAQVIRAKNTPYIQTDAPLIIGVDPAREGKDRICLVHRKGRNITKMKKLPKMTLTELSSYLAKEIRQYSPTKMFIDVGGLGIGVYDMMVANKYDKIVVAVNFGGSPDDKDKYVNKRAEMYGEARRWLEAWPCHITTTDQQAADQLQAELCSVGYTYSNNQALQMEKKEKMKERGLPSPDMADAFVLTFAFPVGDPSTSRNSSHFVAKISAPKL